LNLLTTKISTAHISCMGSLGFTSQFYSWKGKPTNLKCLFMERKAN